MDIKSIRRIFDIPKYQLYKNPLKNAVNSKKDNIWRNLSTKEYIEKINSLSRGFISSNRIMNEKIAIISENRIEWTIVDLGVQQIGGIVVPIYPTVSKEDFNYIFKHAEISHCFVSNKTIYDKIKHLKDTIPSLKEIYSFDDIENVKNWQELIDTGERELHLQKDVDEISEKISEDTLASIIYTSGTTGIPKGVMISHKNVIKGMQKGITSVKITQGDTILSFLPMSHILERIVVYIYQIYGCPIYFTEIENIADDMKYIKPHFLTAVPRLIEKIYDKIYSKGKELSFIKRSLFFWAIKVGNNYTQPNENGFIYYIKLFISRILVFNKWKEALGGNIKCILSGGASLQERLARIFTAAGIKIIEGYGLTETCAVGTINSNFNKDFKIGTVGKPICDELKITEDGEILIKGENVMKGYYKDEEKTREVLKDGYLYTGDVGIIDKEGFVKIIDRKKEMFKTSGGKYISPQYIENLLKESLFIEQVIVIGEGKKFPSAIIKPDFDFLEKWAKFKNIVLNSFDDIIANNILYQRILKELQEKNNFLGDWEKIKEFRIINDFWSIETGELTPTLKLKRNFIIEKYKDLINSIYS